MHIVHMCVCVCVYVRVKLEVQKMIYSWPCKTIFWKVYQTTVRVCMHMKCNIVYLVVDEGRSSLIALSGKSLPTFNLLWELQQS